MMVVETLCNHPDDENYDISVLMITSLLSEVNVWSVIPLFISSIRIYILWLKVASYTVAGALASRHAFSNVA